MTIQELYAAIDGNYGQAAGILRMDRLIERYVCRFPENNPMERLRKAGEEMDAAGIFEGAHAMKGLCGNLGFDRFSEAAGELAEEFRPGSARQFTDAQVREKLQNIEALYTRTVDGIRAYEREKN